MRLSVWAKKELLPQITEIETAKEACGIGGIVGNKGGLIAKMSVGGTSLCFISSHLAAHEGEKKAMKRNADVMEILAGARVGRQPWLDCSLQFDHCFWMGDLNYRVDLAQLDGVERSKEAHWAEVSSHVESGNWAMIQDAVRRPRQTNSPPPIVLSLATSDQASTTLMPWSPVCVCVVRRTSCTVRWRRSASCLVGSKAGQTSRRPSSSGGAPPFRACLHRAGTLCSLHRPC